MNFLLIFSYHSGFNSSIPNPISSKPGIIGKNNPRIPSINNSDAILYLSLENLRSLVENLVEGYKLNMPIKILIKSINDLIKSKYISVHSEKIELEESEESLAEIILPPRIPLLAESPLNTKELQDIGEIVIKLLEFAPELDFNFKMIILVEGIDINEDKLEKLNSILKKINPNFKFKKIS